MLYMCIDDDEKEPQLDSERSGLDTLYICCAVWLLNLHKTTGREIEDDSRSLAPSL
jgi:hypothetical protein